MKSKFFLFFIISLATNLKVITFLDQLFSAEYLTVQNPEENVIYSYKSDLFFSEANEFYTKGAGVIVPEKTKNRMIKYADIPIISSFEGVSQIIMLDYQFFDQLNQKYLNRAIIEEFTAISVPNYINKENDLLGFSFGFNDLKKGRLPMDNKNEIALSIDQLIKYFNYDLVKIDEAIGQSIIYQGEIYSIVGLTYSDIAFLSYNATMNLGFKTYNSEDFEAFVYDNEQYKMNKNLMFFNEVDELLIYTDNGKEKDVLNLLMKTFPAENYFSSDFLNIWIKTYFRENFLKIALINLFLISLTNVGLFYLNQKILKIKFKFSTLFLFCTLILILTLTFAPLNHLNFKYISIINSIILTTPYFIKKDILK